MDVNKTTIHWQDNNGDGFTAEKVIDNVIYNLFYFWDGENQTFGYNVEFGDTAPCIHHEDIHIENYLKYKVFGNCDEFSEVEPNIMQTIRKLRNYLDTIGATKGEK